MALIFQFKQGQAKAVIKTIGGSLMDAGSELRVDSSNNAYVLGFTESINSNYDLLLLKIDENDNVVWQRTLGTSTQHEPGYGLGVDSVGNVYICGHGYNSTYGYDIIVAKFSSSGSLSWQRSIRGSGTSAEYGNELTVDSSNNIYVGGSTNTSGNEDIFLAKYNSNGIIQWQRTLGATGTDALWGGLATDSSDNIIISGHYNETSTTSTGVIAKYDPSGNVLWQTSINASSDFVRLTGVVVDDSNNIYFVGYNGPSGAYNSIIGKMNSNGNLQWIKQLSGTGSDQLYEITIVGSKLYIGGTTSSIDTTYNMLIASMDVNGNLLWQRYLGGSGTDSNAGIAFRGDHILFTGRTTTDSQGGYDVLYASVLNSGAGLGTYGNNTYTYNIANLTFGDSSLTAGTSSLINQTSSLTETAGSYSTASVNLSVSSYNKD